MITDKMIEAATRTSIRLTQDEKRNYTHTEYAERMLEAAEQERWQPIETAPRDGRYILLVGGRETDGNYLEEGIEKPTVAFWGRDDNVWYSSYWDDEWRSHYKNPTHWQPLTPPKEDEDDEPPLES